MYDVRKYTVYPPNLNFLECFKNLKQHLGKLGWYEDKHSVCDKTAYNIKIGDSRKLQCIDFEEFIDTFERYPSAVSIFVHSHWEENKSKNTMTLIFNIEPEYISIDVGAAQPDFISGIHERVAEIFKASNPPDNRSTRLSKYQLKKSIFIAHRFDEIGNTNASTLSKFLTILRFNVIEGGGYETRDIPNKVSDKIKSQDIFICIITPGDPTWIMGETAFAKALNKYIIILCQNPLDINKGIIGNDYEHLSFPENNIEKCFSDLLWALPY